MLRLVGYPGHRFRDGLRLALDAHPVAARAARRPGHCSRRVRRRDALVGRLLAARLPAVAR